MWKIRRSSYEIQKTVFQKSAFQKTFFWRRFFWRRFSEDVLFRGRFQRAFLEGVFGGRFKVSFEKGSSETGVLKMVLSSVFFLSKKSFHKEAFSKGSFFFW